MESNNTMNINKENNSFINKNFQILTPNHTNVNMNKDETMEQVAQDLVNINHEWIKND